MKTKEEIQTEIIQKIIMPHVLSDISGKHVTQIDLTMEHIKQAMDEYASPIDKQGLENEIILLYKNDEIAFETYEKLLKIIDNIPESKQIHFDKQGLKDAIEKTISEWENDNSRYKQPLQSWIRKTLDTLPEPKVPSEEEIKEWIKGHGYYGTCTTEYYEGLEEGANFVISYMKGEQK